MLFNEAVLFKFDFQLICLIVCARGVFRSGCQPGSLKEGHDLPRKAFHDEEVRCRQLSRLVGTGAVQRSRPLLAIQKATYKFALVVMACYHCACIYLHTHHGSYRSWHSIRVLSTAGMLPLKCILRCNSSTASTNW